MKREEETMQQYPHLFSPLKIGGLTLKNRIENVNDIIADIEQALQ